MNTEDLLAFQAILANYTAMRYNRSDGAAKKARDLSEHLESRLCVAHTAAAANSELKAASQTRPVHMKKRRTSSLNSVRFLFSIFHGVPILLFLVLRTPRLSKIHACLANRPRCKNGVSNLRRRCSKACYGAPAGAVRGVRRRSINDGSYAT